MTQDDFIEKRKQYRLPFAEKVVFSDGTRAMASYAANLSRGGIFLMTLDASPIDTYGHLAFFLPNQSLSFCVKAKVAHIIMDRQRCEVECGMGFQFMEMNEAQKSVLNLHILNEQATYQELQRHLAVPRPDANEIARCLKRAPYLKQHDLLALRYRVNRICTLFEPNPVDEKIVAA